MSYRIKRIDPYWIKNPVLPAVAVIGVLAGLVLVGMGMVLPAVIAGVIGGAAVVLATAPAATATMAAVGLLFGSTTFLLYPNPENASMSLPMKLLATVCFMLFYAVVMDGLILLFAVLYNLFSSVVGLGGIGLDLEVEEEAPEGGA